MKSGESLTLCPDRTVLIPLGWITIAAVLLAGCLTSGPPEAGEVLPELAYQVLIEDTSDQTAEIQVTFSHLPDEDLELRWGMAERYALVRLKEPLLSQQIHFLDAEGLPLTVARPDPYHWLVNTCGSERIYLKYSVPLRHRSLPSVAGRDEYEHPYLEADHGLLVTGALLAVPQTIRPLSIWVSFSLPHEWEVVCPWDRIDRYTFSVKSVREVSDSLAALGSWSVHDLNVEGMAVQIAFAPGQDLLETKAVPLIEKVVGAEIKLFGSAPLPRYIFFFGKPQEFAFGGSPKTGAMTLSAGPLPDGSLPMDSLTHLIAHEFFHTWAKGLFDCPDELRFFCEGFTDYYAYLISAREGLSTWEDFAAVMGRCMSFCEEHRSKTSLSLAAAGGPVFFTDPMARTLVYKGGFLVAGLLDARIRHKRPRRNLDDFMRTLINDPRWKPGEAAPGLEDFLHVAGVYGGDAFAERLGRLVREPYVLDPVSLFSEAGVEVVKKKQQARLILRGNLDGTTLKDLDPVGLAFRLGIRPGDRFKQVNGLIPAYPGDVYSAWSRPLSGRIQVIVERNGESIQIDEPVPQELVFVVNLEPWTSRN
ncbi:MAG: M61 family metallopeptidase [Planctomycetota bacterium]